jgi:OOP family OmpA-OmpF porin
MLEDPVFLIVCYRKDCYLSVASAASCIFHLEGNIFDFNKSNIRPDDMAKLQSAVDFVKRYPGSKVRIEGCTDSIGTEKYNQALSERRAEAVSSYLVKEGACEQANASAAGYGETNPVASNKTEKGRAKNRRVEILIMSE